MTDDEQQSKMGTGRDGSTGQSLREARESAGYSVAEVAEQQNLRPTIIETIEAGQYEQIDSELFLKGYVRSYAGVLGLDADALIDRLDEELEPFREEAEEARRNDPLEEIERRKRQKQRVARWTAGLVLAILAIWFVYWFAQSDLARSGGEMLQQTMEKGANGEEEAAEDDASADAPDDTTEALEDDDLVSTGAVDEVNTNEASSTTVEPSATQAPSEGDAPSAGQASSTGQESSNGETPPQPSRSAPASDPDTSASEPDTMSDASATGPDTAPVSHEVVIEFSGDCWVQIQDGGRTVVSELQRAGDEVRHSGTGPFRIVLGAVDAASVNFDGEVVDLTEIPAPNNRAVLTLGNDNA